MQQGSGKRLVAPSFVLLRVENNGATHIDTRQLYAGRITNWTDVGGNNQPVRLVSRNPDSGTRKTLDIVRAHGDRPCAELQNPVRCRP